MNQQNQDVLKVIKINDCPLIVYKDSACLWSVQLFNGYKSSKKFLNRWFDLSGATKSDLTGAHYKTLTHHRGVCRWDIVNLGAYWVSPEQVKAYSERARLRQKTKQSLTMIYNALIWRRKSLQESEESRPETWQDRYQRALTDLQQVISPALLSSGLIEGAVDAWVIDGVSNRGTGSGDALRALDRFGHCDMVCQLSSEHIVGVSCKSTRKDVAPDALLLSMGVRSALFEADMIVSAPDGVIQPEYYLSAQLDDMGVKSMTLIQRWVVVDLLKQGLRHLSQTDTCLESLTQGQGVRFGPIRYRKQSDFRVMVSLQFSALQSYGDHVFKRWVRPSARPKTTK